MTTKMPASRPNNHLLLGDLPDFQSRPFTLLRELAGRPDPVVRLRFGPAYQYVISHPEGARQVLQQNNRNYRKEQQFMEIIRLALASGDDLFTSDDEAWLFRRRLMQPAFHRRVVDGFSAIIGQETERQLAQWEPGVPIELEQAMMDLTMSIIGRTMFSQNILDEYPRLYEAFGVISDYVIDRATTLSGRMVPHFLPTPRNRAFKEALTLCRSLLQQVIARRQRLDPAMAPADLLSLMMAARDDEQGQGLTTTQLMDEMLGIVMAGHETSSVTLSWLFQALAENPAVRERLEEEVKGALGGRLPTVADLPQLPYLEQVVAEAMRRYPAAYVTTRESLGSDEVLGYAIPAKAMVLINIYGLHHHEAYWEAPERFWPERFAPENAGNLTKFTYLPFGEGPRKCIGAPLAQLEIQLITAAIVQRFRLLPDPARPARLVTRFTLRSAHGMWMTPQSRGGGE